MMLGRVQEVVEKLGRLTQLVELRLPCGWRGRITDQHSPFLANLALVRLESLKFNTADSKFMQLEVLDVSRSELSSVGLKCEH